MSDYRGDLVAGAVHDFLFAGVTSSGAPAAVAGLVLSVYKGNSTTESTAGVTTTFSGGFDGRLGLVQVHITTASDATFYAAGNDFMVVITAGTINGVSAIGRVVGEFSIANRVVSAVTGAVGSVTGAVGSVTGNVGGNVTGSVGSVVGAVGSVTGNVGGNVVGSAGSVVGAVGSVTGAVGSVTGAVGSVTGLTASDVGAIKAKTDNLPASPAAVSNVPTAIENADALLNRNLATGTDSGSPTVRTVRQALRALRNKWTVAAGTYTSFKEDDTTTNFTAAVTGTTGADPITESDPAGP